MRTPDYADLVGGRPPLDLMAATPQAIEAAVRSWTPARFERSYGPGKWTASQLLQHLAQIEITSGNRIRLALTTPDYVVQPWDADRWMAMESPPDGCAALLAYRSLRAWNLHLYRRLTQDDRTAPFWHPEIGPLSIEWFFCTLAGHDLHHLRHLRMIGAQEAADMRLKGPVPPSSER